MNAGDTTHELYEELAVGHALSALEPADEQDFLAHLLSCDPCKVALAEHNETLAHLAYAAVSDAPPAGVLAGIRAGVAESGRAGAFPAPLSLAAARTRRRDKPVRWTTAVIGFAASLILVGALLFVNHGLQSRQRQTEAANGQLNKAVASLLVAGSRKIDLTGSQGKGVLVIHGSTASFVAAGLPANDRSTSVYVLWEMSRVGDIRSIGTFDIRNGGTTVVNNLHVLDPAQVRRFMVTRERGRSAPAQSTQPPVVSGDA